MKTDIGRRKDEHLDLASTEAVAFRGRSTLLEEVTLIHESLPELSVDELDLTADVFGKRLRAPLLIASMTGGTERAGAINRDLAAVAEARGYALGLGSQRAMQKDAGVAETFRVRDVAKSVLLFGNIGVVQAREQETRALASLVEDVGADALFVHMNPAQEIVQAGGDRDFRGGLAALARLVRELGVPVVAKETGCGISAGLARRLADVGITTVDVSGAGGTSWVAVETLRASGTPRGLGETLWDWGTPTAVSVAWCARAGLVPFATGGIKTGLDVARALALGAHLAGIARPVLQAWTEGGRDGVERFFDRVEAELRAVMLLTGSRTPEALRRAPKLLGPELERWLALDAPGR